jgi:hypothetical protein
MHFIYMFWFTLLFSHEMGTMMNVEAAPPFMHNINNLKTRLCSTYTSTGRCPYNERCTYAHGIDELRRGARIEDVNTVSLSMSSKHHEERIVELETDLERAWQHIHRLEKDVYQKK